MGAKAKTKTKTMMMWAAWVLATAALMEGCATLRTSGGDEAVLLERAHAYWEARFAQDMARALSFEDPLRRNKLNLVSYIRMVGEPAKVYSVAVKGAKIAGDQADVEVEMVSHLILPPWNKELLRTTLIDDWQRLDGVWYHVLDLHLIRAGKPRVNMARGTIDYPPAPPPPSTPVSSSRDKTD